MVDICGTWTGHHFGYTYEVRVSSEKLQYEIPETDSKKNQVMKLQRDVATQAYKQNFYTYSCTLAFMTCLGNSRT